MTQDFQKNPLFPHGDPYGRKFLFSEIMIGDRNANIVNDRRALC